MPYYHDPLSRVIVEVVNHDAGMVWSEDNQEGKISYYLDEDGNTVTDREEAVAFMVQWKNRLWSYVHMDSYSSVTLN